MTKIAVPWIDISWFIGFVSYITLSGLTIVYFFKALNKFGNLFRTPFILITQGFFFFILLGLLAGILSHLQIPYTGVIAATMVTIGLFAVIMTFLGYKVLFDTLTNPGKSPATKKGKKRR